MLMKINRKYDYSKPRLTKTAINQNRWRLLKIQLQARDQWQMIRGDSRQRIARDAD
jgi:hypothetical protein